MEKKPRKASPGARARSLEDTPRDTERQADETPSAPTLPAAERNSPDGGTAEHPLHDDDLEDRDSEDFEHEIDEVDEVDETAELDVILRKRS
jgi:hypothetical protein